jgi:hypothetical protein
MTTKVEEIQMNINKDDIDDISTSDSISTSSVSIVSSSTSPPPLPLSLITTDTPLIPLTLNNNDNLKKNDDESIPFTTVGLLKASKPLNFNKNDDQSLTDSVNDFSLISENTLVHSTSQSTDIAIVPDSDNKRINSNSPTKRRKHTNSKSNATTTNVVNKITKKNEISSADSSSVRVAVRIRPQSLRERLENCNICTIVHESEPQISLGQAFSDKSFTYDYVFNIKTRQDTIFNDCVKNLIDGCLQGYNATVLAYGQTGSGKTYTMGTSFDENISVEEEGIIPRAVSYLFEQIDKKRNDSQLAYMDRTDSGLTSSNLSSSSSAIDMIDMGEEAADSVPDFQVTAQFMELYNEEIIDLFNDVNPLFLTSLDNGPLKSNKIEIHEDQFGGINVSGCSRRTVSSVNETLELLKNGARIRTTGATNMNLSSSRSHAIFTLHIKQQHLTRNE